ncbi:hypothetical protein HDU86_001362 [Geranomyces michiganensis]|nr:hypothetical protein HDU86_001362 [Geranomyces michiganensis]
MAVSSDLPIVADAFGIDPRDVNTPDDWVPRDPSLIRLTGDHPFNAESPVKSLVETLDGGVNPTSLHYVRNHGPVPKLDYKTFQLEIGGLDTTPRTFQMADLLAMPSITLAVTLTCCGNRRQEQNIIKKSQGFKWGAGAVSTALYQGVSLPYILSLCNIDATTASLDSLFLCADGADELPKGIYGTSVPLARALDPFGDVMVAYSMNGQPLTPDHGFPLRLIMPGFVGGRMVKWLNRLTIQDHESTSWYHLHDNRVLPPPPLGPGSGEEAVEGNWWTRPEYIINERNINSVISHPGHNETVSLRLASSNVAEAAVQLKGYAYSGGGRQITRVEISLDDGLEWLDVQDIRYDFAPRHGHKYWCWFLWTCTLPLSRVAAAKDICVRAWDSALNTQPKDITWNLLGMMSNSWYRVKISFDTELNLVFTHPTNVGGDTPGWMQPGSELSTTSAKPIPAVVGSGSASAQPFLPLYKMSEIEKHNTKASCWIVLNDKVLDCTAFLAAHPGGASSILIKGGQDATTAFYSIHSKQAAIVAEKYVIGAVDHNEDSPMVNGNPGDKPTTSESVKKSLSAVKPNGLNGGAQVQDAPATTAVSMVSPPPSPRDKKTVIVVGLGMVGLRFCEKLIEYDTQKKVKIVVFAEESLAAYNRVGLTNYFSHRSVPDMLLATADWYSANDVTVHLGTPVTRVDPTAKTVVCKTGEVFAYDHCVLAMGSSAMMPPLPGRDCTGVFAYRTLTDLDNMIAHSRGKTRAVVIGGGLLGLEAAKACVDLGLTTTVCERSPWLMRRQLDRAGGEILQAEMGKLGVKVIVNARTQKVVRDADGCASQLLLQTGPESAPTDQIVETDLIVLSCGIVPRDEVARAAGIVCAPRGGIVVDNWMRTSEDSIFAIGECAVHQGTMYGLVAPGYDMADIAARTLVHGVDDAYQFSGADMSTKLKLLGVHVASFGDYFLADETPVPQTEHFDRRPMILHDPFAGTYKRLVLSGDGKRLLGGILVGDTADYGMLLSLTKSGQDVSGGKLSAYLGAKTFDSGAPPPSGASLPDDAQVCSCNNVTKGAIVKAVRSGKACNVAEAKSCTKAGTSCGGCVPLLTEVVNVELEAMGKTVTLHLCEHFKFSRTELYEIVKIKEYKTFDALIRGHGSGVGGIGGCEVCKPAAASIFASLWNEHVLDHAAIQDTNDKYLANIQRDGSFSVIPRVAGGEITPEGLLVIGQIAKEYNLYCKISGGQRIVMFGVQKQDLPDVWERLVAAGFETGHAYGKSLRTVKSCVGSEWCRFGMRDSVRFAIDIEHRYKGLRSPHKIKAAVSGCVRECAEAGNKDAGLIATDKGYNLYVCGNGGTKPKHAVLLVTDITEEQVIKYLDRFFIYYIKTADKLMRTARWLEKLPGGIDYLRAVVVDDCLGIGEEMERQMQQLVDSYQDEWATVVADPIRRAAFRQFVNTTENERTVERVKDKLGQERPANWPADSASRSRVQRLRKKAAAKQETDSDRNDVAILPPLPAPVSTLPPKSKWTYTALSHVRDIPADGGAAVKYGQTQLAIFRFAALGTYYATQNMCPHKRAFVLSQGILGTTTSGSDPTAPTPKVSCPMHKKNFSLESGKCLSDENETLLLTFDVRVEDSGVISVLLPPVEKLDAVLGTSVWMVRANERDGWATGVEVDGASAAAEGGCSSGPCSDKKLEW